MKKIKARIRFINLNMGFWTLESNENKYEVVNMPAQLKNDGDQTVVWINELKGQASINMYGTLVKIVGFET